MDKHMIDGFATKTVLVLGDVMVDRYIWGRVTRINPEAPVPLVDVYEENVNPGGAANVAANIAALGGKVILVGVSGNDNGAQLLMPKLHDQGIEAFLIRDNSRRTPTKVRVMAQKQQLLRYDIEDRHPVDEEINKSFVNVLLRKSYDAIALSDYAKGTITQSVYDLAKTAAANKGIPLIIDPKPANKIAYAGATMIKLNHKEACELADAQEQNGDALKEIGEGLAKKLQSHIIVTRAEKGVSIFYKGGGHATIETKARQVSDVSGAGDTFLAALTLAHLNNARLEDAVLVANHAAGIKVGKVGAVPVSAAELKKDLEQ